MKKKIVSIALAFSVLVALPTFAANSDTVTDEVGQENEYHWDLERWLQLRQEASDRARIALWQVDSMVDRGYIPEEIAEMTSEQVDEILTRDLDEEGKAAYYQKKADTMALSAKATAPSGYTYIENVPDNGGSAEWFHPDVNTTESTINSVVAGAKSIAQTIFKTTASYSTICYSYYLCGEWGEDTGRENWCHEGIDMQHTTKTTAAVYSPISGYVSKSSTSGKYVNIYNAALGITVNIQHLNNLDGTGTLVEGSYVEAGQYLGNQNTTDCHVHLQVCTHTECTVVHSGRDLNLECERPDLYL